VAHRHVDLGAVAAGRVAERMRYRGRDIRQQFESRHHGVERNVGSLMGPSAAHTSQPFTSRARRRGLVTRLLASIATRTDTD